MANRLYDVPGKESASAEGTNRACLTALRQTPRVAGHNWIFDRY